VPAGATSATPVAAIGDRTGRRHRRRVRHAINQFGGGRPSSVDALFPLLADLEEKQALRLDARTPVRGLHPLLEI
jgi:hypothetical protein